MSIKISAAKGLSIGPMLLRANTKMYVQCKSCGHQWLQPNGGEIKCSNCEGSGIDMVMGTLPPDWWKGETE